MKKKSILLAATFAVLGAGNLSASPKGADQFYCAERKLGYYFYCDKPKTKKQNKPAVSQTPAKSATERLAEITKKVDELKARAIMEPTEENVLEYVRFQREQLDRASNFADVWRRALWKNPQDDYTIERPVSTVGKQTWKDNRRAQEDQVLANLGERYGMFYFFTGTCGACKVFAPILKSFSQQNNITVLAVSIDGTPSPEFPGYVVDSGQRKRMGLASNTTPALVLFDSKTKRPIPIGYGVLAMDELRDRIFALTKLEVGKDF